MNKTAKIISNIVYGIGVGMVVALGCIALFGPTQTVNPNAMIPFTWREQAFLWLAFGSIPMLLSCMAVYKFNTLKDSSHKKRNLILVFVPGIICAVCALFIIGLLIAGMVNSFLFH